MSAEIRGSKQLSARLHAIDDRRALLTRWQIMSVAEAKKIVPHKTHNLSRSIAPGAIIGSSAFVVARAGHGAYVEKGTGVYGPKKKAITIEAPPGGVLRFPASGASTTLGGRVRTGEVERLGSGAYVFATKVTIQGMKARPFLKPGAQKARDKGGLTDYVVELWNKAA